jgi:hypothetical protein
MFIKDPKNRPTATQMLQTPFIIRHREVLDSIIKKSIIYSFNLENEINRST